MPRVSVIIPCFNAGSYLEEAIQSILDQTYSSFEILIVNDGSTDNTPDVVARFNDQRIRYFYQQNKGLSAARNAGILVSDGEYIAFLDADDWFVPSKLEVQTRFLDMYADVGCVASGWVDTDERGDALRIVEPWHWKPDMGLAECVLGVPLVPHCVLVRRVWLEAVGLFDEGLRYREDWDLWLKLAAAGCKIVWLPELVCRYRVRANSLAHNWQGMRDGGQAALDKIFSRPDLPDEVRLLRPQAYAALHIDAAVRAYGAQDFHAGYLEIAQAIKLRPDLLEGKPCTVVQSLVAWMDNPLVGNQDEYLDTLGRNLPPEVPSARRQVRWAVSSRYMDKAFSAYQQDDYTYTLAWLRRSVWLDPRWLRNRGVLSIGVRALTCPKRRVRSLDKDSNG